jgi:hypothetical protein
MFSRLAEMCGCLYAEKFGCVDDRGNVEIFFSKRESLSKKAIFV